MSDRTSVFRNRLLKTALHLDFVRIRCGAEETFRKGIDEVAKQKGVSPHVFAALSEWDAVVVLPCDTLYPESLTSLYASARVASSISGSAGYFAYLWQHGVNVDERNDLARKIRRMSNSGIGALMSLRFDDRVRRELGLGAELLLCDYLQETLREYEGIEALVAHTLGWNDVVIMLHAKNDETRLLPLLTRLRLLTVEECVGKKIKSVPRLAAIARNPIFAASYTHLIGSYADFVRGTMHLGALTDHIATATLLVRVVPSLESEVRDEIVRICRGIRSRKRAVDMPSEMGHFSFSVDVTDLAKKNRDGNDLLKVIMEVRRFIGKASVPANESYAETSTRLRFLDTGPSPKVQHPAADPELQADLQRVDKLLIEIPPLLRNKGASAMTIHRFNSILTTLLDNLADPVRSSVVRHLARFMFSTPKLIAGLEREDIDDLCHVCEYAVMQATDGVAQFQHDAASLGLTGRGGYSRLILAMEMYMRDLFVLLDVKEIVPLLTFGLRSGSARRGSTGRFQTDLSFNTVFVPSSWYILVHEAGHTAWMSTFGWVGESLATFNALEKEITHTIKDRNKAHAQTRVEFIRTREIVRELFANYLVYRVSCGGDIRRFDRLSLHHIMASRTGGGTRELLIAVVLHCLLKMTEAEPSATGGDWWSGWERRRKSRKTHERDVQDAIDSIDAAMKSYIRDSVARAKREKDDRREHAKQTIISAKQRLLKTDMFHEVALSALKSVLDVLAFSSREFGGARAAHSTQFSEFQHHLAEAGKKLPDYDKWIAAGLGTWLESGDVLALSPPAWILSKLLLDVREHSHDQSPPAFLVSQLSVILAMWHRSVTQRLGPGFLDQVLEPLGLVEFK
jgi:hypothetical protein